MLRGSQVQLALQAGFGRVSSVRVQLLALIECGRIRPAGLSKEAAEGDAGLRRAPGSPPMSDELAMMWRIICTWLQVRWSRCLHPLARTLKRCPVLNSCVNAMIIGRSWTTAESLQGTRREALAWRCNDLISRTTLLWRVAQDEGTAKGQAAAAASGAVATVEAARASDALEALEAALPAAAEQLMDLVAEHAASGALFAARQLLAITARCIDLSDAAGRTAAAELVQVRGLQMRQLLLLFTRSQFQVSAPLSEIICVVVHFMRSCCAEHHGRQGGSASEGASDGSGCDAAGGAGRGLPQCSGATDAGRHRRLPPAAGWLILRQPTRCSRFAGLLGGSKHMYGSAKVLSVTRVLWSR